MGYFPELRAARQWLLESQNDDGGWGMVPGQPSSMVNTAEALYVLAKAGSPNSDCEPGLDFVRSHLPVHLAERGKRTRYVAFPLMTLGECFPAHDAALLATMGDWLRQAQNKDDGWGDEAEDQKSDVFSTYLAVEALSGADQHLDSVAAAARWMSSQQGASGWRLHPDQPHSIAATAYGVLTLARASLHDVAAFSAGRELLLATEYWDHEEVVIRGTKWLHCRAAAVIRALNASEADVFHPTIAEGIRFFQRRADPRRGWVEEPNENSPTIRSQYWAATALDSIHARLDPAVYVPRVDAERSQAALREPGYVPFMVNSPLHTIVPSVVLRWTVYCLLIVGFVSASGLLERVPVLPSRAIAPVLGVSMVAAGVVLVRKRPKQFPRLGRWVPWILAITGILGLLFGFSIYDMLHKPLSSATQWVFGPQS